MQSNFTGGFLPDKQEEKEKNWLFGAAPRPIINESGDYTLFLPTGEKQATNYFDPYSCVSSSLTNVVETLLSLQMEWDITLKPLLESLGALDENGKPNFSERFVAVGSGTIPGRGNSQHNVFEFVRKNGLVGEKHWPSRLDMTESEYFALTPQNIKDLGKKFLQYFSFEYEDVGESNAELKEALKRSPLCVVVGGTYLGSEIGMSLYRPVSLPVQYNHQVENYAQEYNVSDFSSSVPLIHDIFDSYEPFKKRFWEKYPFAYAKAIYLKKKLIPMMYKKIGQPAICFKHLAEPYLIAFADGSIPGGDLFKSLFGVEKYSDLPRQDVEEWPYPIKYHLTTTGLEAILD